VVIEAGGEPSGRGGLHVLVAGAVVVACVVAIAALLAGISAGDPDGPAQPQFDIDQLAEGAAPILIDNKPTFLVREGGNVWAIKAVTPLREQPLFWCARAQQFFDPLSGSDFDIDGVKLDGPAARGLDRYHVDVDDGVVAVDSSRVAPGPPIGTRSTRPLPARSGLVCADPVASPVAAP